MKIFFLILFIFLSTAFIAQIPNSSFENWTNYGSYEDPTSWTSYNGFTYQTGVFTCMKASPGFAGNYYVSLVTQTMMPSGSLAGLIMSGVPYQGSSTVFKGYPFTNRPATLDGEWQYNSPASGSNCFITVYLTKWNSNLLKRDTICYQTTVLSGTVSTWTAFSINLGPGYKSSLSPDSCVISMKSSITQAVPVGSFLRVDNLSFNGFVTAINEMALHDNLRIYPNPVSRYVKIEASENEKTEISIIDELGREVINTTEQTLDLETLSPGIYTVRCNIDSKFYYKKIIKT